MGTLKLQVGDGTVFAYYLPSNAGPNVGGYRGQVFPGGHFKGVGFEQLRALGNGRHEFALDERIRSERGREPEFESDWHRQFERFQFSLFIYGVGACVAREVLDTAREVIRLELQSEWPEPGTESDGKA